MKMNKKRLERPNMDVIAFDTGDIITTSSTSSGDESSTENLPPYELPLDM